MAETTTVTFRLDRGLKERADLVLQDMGLSMTAALTVFVRTMVRQARIPFPVESDPFYTDANQAWLEESIAEAERGQFAHVTTLEDLEAALR